MKEPSTSSFSHQFTYDVFISFRGEDLRHRFVGNLRHSLHRRGIKVFKDDDGDIRKGENITDTLMKTIEESQTAILVFSKHYATSSFCLRELVHIQKCIRGHNRAIWVVFYDVNPSDVRHQKNSYESAFQRYYNERDEKGERKYKEDEVKEWKVALKKAADICGWHWESSKCKMTTIGDPSGETSGSALEEQGQPSQQQKSTCVQSRCEYEHEFIGSIEKEISRKISRVPFLVANHPVGLDTRVLKISSLLEDSPDEKVVFVGICGIGGLGKTTVARAVYNKIANKFEGFICFLDDVKEESRKNGVVKLQERMLSEILGEDIRVGDANKGIPIIKRRLNQKKVLLILDNVDKKEQLDKLAGGYDWFGCGSKIIITTRDRHLLLTNGVERQKIYEMEKLNEKESLELLSWNAFKSKQVDPCFMDISRCVIQYAQGLPLAIEVIGSALFGKSIEEWKSVIDIYRKTPNEDIHEILKVSYDGLKEVEKDIFLDMACFYKGKELGYVKDLVKYAHGFDDPSYAIGVLIDKCLMSIDDWMRIEMHDLIQDMGREIVRQESPRERGKRSRLWFHEDIIHVLENDTGTNEVLVMVLEYMPKTIEINWNGKAFKNMKNLKILILDKLCFSKAPKYLPNSLRVLQWKGYPGSCLPDNFNPRNLVVLNLANSYIESLGPMKRLNNVTVLNLSDCKFVTRVPDISGIPNLIEFIIDFCHNLIEIHDSVGFLNKLVTLSAKNCFNLRAFPLSINLPYLKNLGLWGCSSLKKFPEVLGEMKYVKSLDLSSTKLEVPFSIRNLVALESIEVVWGGFGLKQNEDQEEGNSMPISSVTTIELHHCNISDEFFPICVSWFGNVKILNLSGSNFKVLPACINKLHLLESLYVDDCKQLREIKGIPPYIKELRAINCTLLSSESRNVLMGKELHDEDVSREVYLPGSTIPEWFHHRSRSPSISFWYRNKFPQISLCFVLAPTHDPMRAHMIIDDGKIKFSTTRGLLLFCQNTTRGLQFFDLHEDHILFINVHLDIPLVSEWSHVEIFLLSQQFGWNHPKDRMILAKEAGLCLRKKDEIKEEDIRFTNPYKRTKLLHHFSFDSNSGLRLMTSAWTNNNFRDKDMKSQEGTVVGRDHQFISNNELKYEIAKVAFKGRLVDCEGADRFVQLMQRLSGDWVSDLTGPHMLVDVIRYTEVEYYSLSIKGLPLLDKWIQDVLNGKFDDTESHYSVLSFLNASLRALYYLPVSLSDLRTYNMVETVDRLQHKSLVDNTIIADKLVAKWVDEIILVYSSEEDPIKRMILQQLEENLQVHNSNQLLINIHHSFYFHACSIILLNLRSENNEKYRHSHAAPQHLN